MQTTTLTAEVALSTARMIDEIASQRQQPRGWVIEQAIGAWIDREAGRHRQMLELCQTSMPAG